MMALPNVGVALVSRCQEKKYVSVDFDIHGEPKIKRFS
jgi:hypothetical protein